MKNTNTISHNLFKPKTMQDAMDAAVGPCNGLFMQERWEKYEELEINQVWLFHIGDFEKCYSQFYLDKVSLHGEARGLYFNYEGKLFWMYYIKSYKFCTIYDVREFKSFTDIFKCVKTRMEEYRNNRMKEYEATKID